MQRILEVLGPDLGQITFEFLAPYSKAEHGHRIRFFGKFGDWFPIGANECILTATDNMSDSTKMFLAHNSGQVTMCVSFWKFCLDLCLNKYT